MTLPAETIHARMLSVSGASFARSLDKLDRLIIQGTVPIPVVTAVLATDPMLTALVLSEANATSASELTQLSGAMLHIGLGSVLGLIRRTTSLPEPLRQELALCWAQANACATMTRLLAIYCANRLQARYDIETLQCAGLLHDIGTIIAIIHFPEEYHNASDRLEKGTSHFSPLLREELGVDAAQLGAMLARTWRLPGLITACIRHHAAPTHSDSFGEIVAMVHVARVMARACGFTCLRDRFVEELEENALRRLDLHLFDLERLLEQFFDEMEELELYEGMLDGRATVTLPTLRG